jgi:uncharacterized protein YkwD
MSTAIIAGLVLTIALLGNPQISIPELEHKTHILINAERQKRHINSMLLDERLSKIARDHSQDMVKRGFFDHMNPDGRSPGDRVRLAGYNCPKTVGENIFQNNLASRVTVTGDRKTYEWNSLEQIATSSVQGWMSSPGHRHNILEVGYLRTGVGVVITDDGKVYITQLFCG